MKFFDINTEWGVINVCLVSIHNITSTTSKINTQTGNVNLNIK